MPIKLILIATVTAVLIAMIGYGLYLQYTIAQAQILIAEKTSEALRLNEQTIEEINNLIGERSPAKKP